MSEMIVLPPLAHTLHSQPLTNVLQDDTAVTVLVSGLANALPSTFAQAMRQYPQALLALHPIDAPLHLITLPPLPANRRDAALRVKLEDAVLDDPVQLSLAVQPLGANRFAVLAVAKTLLRHVQTVLAQQGHGHRALTSLAASVPPDSEWQLNDWLVWRDETGAGAMPFDPANTASTTVKLNPSHLKNLSAGGKASSKTLLFQTTAQQGSAWKVWRMPLILLGLCALVGLASVWLTWRNALAQSRQIQQDTSRLFKAALPHEPMTGDPVKQLQNALGMSSDSSSSSGDAKDRKDDSNPTLMKALNRLPAEWPSGAVSTLSWQAPRLSVTANAAVVAAAVGGTLDEAKKAELTASLAAHNITLTWSKPQ